MNANYMSICSTAWFYYNWKDSNHIQCLIDYLKPNHTTLWLTRGLTNETVYKKNSTKQKLRVCLFSVTENSNALLISILLLIFKFNLLFFFYQEFVLYHFNCTIFIYSTCNIYPKCWFDNIWHPRNTLLHHQHFF